MIYHPIKSSRKFKIFRYSQKSLKISPSTLFSIPSPYVRVALYWHGRAKQIRTTALQRPPKFKCAYFLWQWVLIIQLLDTCLRGNKISPLRHACLALLSTCDKGCKILLPLLQLCSNYLLHYFYIFSPLAVVYSKRDYLLLWNWSRLIIFSCKSYFFFRSRQLVLPSLPQYSILSILVSFSKHVCHFFSY